MASKTEGKVFVHYEVEAWVEPASQTAVQGQLEKALYDSEYVEDYGVDTILN